MFGRLRYMAPEQFESNAKTAVLVCMQRRISVDTAMARISPLDKLVMAASLLSKVTFLSKGTVWCFPGL